MPLFVDKVKYTGERIVHPNVTLLCPNRKLFAICFPLYPLFDPTEGKLDGVGPVDNRPSTD